MRSNGALSNRREAMCALAGASAYAVSAGAYARSLADETDPASRITGMGLVIYDCNYRRKWMRQQENGFDLHRPLNFAKHCQSLGAGGMQVALGTMSKADIAELRDFVEDQELYLEAIVRAPKARQELTKFESEIATAAEVGALAARTTVIPGRRYEQFNTLEEFRNAEKIARRSLELATPVVEKYQIPLAVENHKDQRLDERVSLLKHIDSEFVGACLDTGNSFALLDGAYEPIEVLAPYAHSVHLKDQALGEYEQGFLLGDIPLGQGSFDLKRMVQTIKKHQPSVRFSLELITRDPLKVPCLTEDYYETLARVSGRDLARTMNFVRNNTASRQLAVSKLALEQQVQLEDANVRESLKYAGEVLGL